jgi:hypothetical protein
MKLLFLSQGKTISDHPGWDYAFKRLVQEGILDAYINIPYHAYQGKWQELWSHVVELCVKESIDIVYFHYYHRRANPDPAPCITELRKLKHNPTIFTSAGDPFSMDWMMPDYPRTFRKCARHCDLTFSTQMGKAAGKIASWGTKNIILSPNSVCPVRFAKGFRTDPITHTFDFDLVMVGNRNGPRFNPISHHYLGLRKRRKVISALDKRYGKKFGLFGHGWKGIKGWQGPIPFDEQQTAFRRGRLAIDGYPYSMADYYSSNRLFFMIASAIPTVTYRVPRLDKILKDNTHCYFYDDIPGLLSMCDRLLNSDPETLYEKANISAKYVEERHTQFHRAKFIVETVKQYHQKNISKHNYIVLDFPFFLDDVDQEKEKPFAVRNWSL